MANRSLHRGGKTILLLGLSLTLVALGCGGATTSSVPVADAETAHTEPAKNETAVQSEPKPTTEEKRVETPQEQDEYTARGMPAIDQTWSVDEAKAAAEAIVRIGKEDPTLLPRLSNARSRKVFERLISRDSLQRYMNPSINLKIRFPAVNELALVNRQILLTYLDAFTKGQPLSRELLEILVLQGEIAVDTWQVIDELVPQLDPKDPTYPTRMAGLEQVRAGTAEMLGGLLTTVTERQHYKTKDLVWYTEQLVTIVPSMIVRVKPDVQASARKQIADMTASEPEPEIKKQLQILSKAAAKK